MDISFEINSAKGDKIKVALSYYDNETIGYISESPSLRSATLYDVTLIRVSGTGIIDYNTLSIVSRTLANFLMDNEDAILCFYCDDLTEVLRHNRKVSPQEYRSNLFSKMFERYTKANKVSGFVNHVVKIVDKGTPRFAHFISREGFEETISEIESLLVKK